MRAQISIIIPTLNAAASLPATLEALMEGLHAGLIRELIISDGGSTDATTRIADEAGARLIEGSASRGGQLRRACAEARGSWILVLHADTRLEPGWSTALAAHLDHGRGAAYFRLRFQAAGLMPALVAGWANLRAALFGLPYGDQGLVLSCRDYTRAGGFADQPLMEDVALIRALRRAGIPLTRLPVCATTSAERYQRAGWLRRGARNLWTLAQYFAGVSPDRLAQSYRR
ncbi:TIGR04283 family arsenosugar biosynthesis glycosyltransferase [Aestuariivita sp.]|jgi:rSAM/selenodomain-associated transferase 2|uniref:TIGR04283 family arsenosugar biosynthesis glycosyltransferase n=1 Tax=Aestuariivita sp. TaxID=1872407 RepID=UPI00216E8311|nr:TIGR04283 family arsenosugar biosynthesis glycosyltransferase [Aestuariivita sp.]MCE8007836.1 glycosyltransferase [Aestuariivita sp.]